MCKISKISAITLHIRVFYSVYWRAYSGTDLLWPCSCIIHACFWLLPTQYWSIQFLFAFYEKKSRFPWLVERVDLQRHDFSSVKTRPAKSYCPRQMEPSWGYFLLLLLYFKLLSCMNASSGSDINSAYRMENLSAWKRQSDSSSFSDERRRINFARALLKK